ncbi:two component histidine kinase 1 [Delitschia confertaspora ATCC 74209]|uniref:Two component histidine kinase 1 n=1 Tax=Delitschia confertaspora ATCC 74209 TaxID=1513339 RepID=A0A9P4JHK8_9PLEO|nr:two component histidine kinase 1 [Delitschia confertaspora ATCC 74209]
MDPLDKLTATGLPIFDLNSEFLDRTDWAQTELGTRDTWPQTLTSLVNLITSFPHAAAIWWGKDLCAVYNLGWAKVTGRLDVQGSRARDTYSGEALGAIESCLRGRTVKVGGAILHNFPDHDPGSTVLLSTILDDAGKRQGVFAQLLHDRTVERYLPLPDSSFDTQQPARQLKSIGIQQTGDKDGRQVDYKQTELFQQFAELLPNGLAILDSNAEAVFVNDGFFKLTTNRTAKEFRAWPESIHPEDYERVMAAYREAFSTRQALRIEFRCLTNENEEWRLFLLRPLNDEPEAGFICALVDITEIKSAQLSQEKAATEARERKEQQERFIDMVSHEIRNPLSAVLHLAEEIKDVAKEIGAKHADLKQQLADIGDAADTILLCVQHQNTLVEDILSFSKLDSMMLSLVPREVQPKWDFSKALKVFNSEFKAKKIKFHYSMDVSYDKNDVDHVIADINRMKQVLVNLVTNAIKFTAEKEGERKISVLMGASIEKPSSYPPNVVFFQSAEDAFHLDSTLTSEWGNGPSLYLMVAIKDTGIGISKDDQLKLFERFRQATPKTQEHYGGSGLGLFISRKLVQLHGGDIGVSSKEGEGSTFGFYFRVRRSDGSSEGGRPPFGNSRSNSNSSNPSIVRSRTPRPPFSRSSSKLNNIHERPAYAERLSSREGADDSNQPSLDNPPTEFGKEAHPESAEDLRYRETRSVVDRMHAKEDDASMNAALEKKLAEVQTEENQKLVDENKNPDATAEEVHKAQSEQQEESDNKRTLLLVEDNLINQKVLKRQLQSRGFEVIVANNGQEAIEAVKARGQLSPDEPEHKTFFDCILMDQEMPVKDGNTATLEIRELQDQGFAGPSPILGVSANAREEQTRSMLNAGMDEVISKPFKVDDLERKIKGMFPE